MDLTNKKRVIVIAISIVVVVAIIFIIIMMVGRQGSAPGAVTTGTPQATSTAPAAPASLTHLPAPAVVVVPDAGAQNVSSGVAVPQVESPAAPVGNSKFRSFSIIIQNGEFIPATINVNQGDTIQLQIGASGGDYDFTQPDYGLHATLTNGQNKTINFSATAPGKFVFYCSSCGGPAKGPVGYLVVAGK